MLKENEYAVPADGDDMTWHKLTPREITIGMELSEDTDLTPLTYAALVATVYRLQDEVYALAAQVVDLREKVNAWEGDS